MPDTPVRRSAAGSALILVPAGVLVLVVLAAIAVDMGVVFLGQRQLADSVTAAANDAAGASVADATFYRQGAVGLDPRRAAEVVCTSLAAQTTMGVRGLVVDVATDNDTVAVRAEGRVEAVFGRAIPGVPRSRRVTATAVAVATTGRRAPRPPFISFHDIRC